MQSRKTNLSKKNVCFSDWVLRSFKLDITGPILFASSMIQTLVTHTDQHNIVTNSMQTNRNVLFSFLKTSLKRMELVKCNQKNRILEEKNRTGKCTIPKNIKNIYNLKISNLLKIWGFFSLQQYWNKSAPILQ